MTFSPELIDASVARYKRERDRYSKLADRVAEICRVEICEANAIRAQVTFRAKSAKSFEGKLQRFSLDPNRNYKSVDDIFSSISDLAGVRIATYRQEDCAEIRDLVSSFFRGKGCENVEIDEKDKNRNDLSNFYRATHAQVYLPLEELVGTYDNLEDVSCEIQICTIIAHVWNEIEHDIGYKPNAVAPTDEERSLLKCLGNNVRAGDSIISDLLAAHAKRINQQEGSFRDIHDFVTRAHEVWQLDEMARNSGQLFDQLRELGIDSLQTLKGVVGDRNAIAGLRSDVVRFNDYLGEDKSLKMDLNSADVLLMALLQHKLKEVIDSHQGRVGRGLGRPNRLYRLARKYKEFNETHEAEI